MLHVMYETFDGEHPQLKLSCQCRMETLSYMSIHIQRRQTEYILVQGTKKEKSSVKVADVTRHYENILLAQDNPWGFHRPIWLM